MNDAQQLALSERIRTIKHEVVALEQELANLRPTNPAVECDCVCCERAARTALSLRARIRRLERERDDNRDEAVGYALSLDKAISIARLERDRNEARRVYTRQTADESGNVMASTFDPMDHIGKLEARIRELGGENARLREIGKRLVGEYEIEYPLESTVQALRAILAESERA